MATYRNGILISKTTLPPGKPCAAQPVPQPTAKAPKREGMSLTRVPPDGRKLASFPQCVHLGEPTGQRLDCQVCGGGKDIPVMSCAVHGECSATRRIVVGGKEYPWCRTCKDKQTTIQPTNKVRLGPGLKSGKVNEQFNSSLFRYKGRLLLAYRTGWAGAKIHIAEMTEDLRPIRNHTLRLTHERANYGQEDPRLFEFDGSLWVSYIGVRGQQRIVDTHQMIARLDDDFRVTDIVYPHYEKRQPWEKNWQFFDWENKLYAVYTIHPQTILCIDGERAVQVFRSDWNPQWSGGALRGGASPVLVGNEWWCFFHGKVEPAYDYSIGVYAFSAGPPFRPVRYTRDPILWSERSTKPAGQYAPVVFPCGAVLDGDRWRVSCGIHDRWTEVFEFDHRHIERVMVRA